MNEGGAKAPLSFSLFLSSLFPVVYPPTCISLPFRPRRLHIRSHLPHYQFYQAFLSRRRLYTPLQILQKSSIRRDRQHLRLRHRILTTQENSPPLGHETLLCVAMHVQSKCCPGDSIYQGHQLRRLPLVERSPAPRQSLHNPESSFVLLLSQPQKLHPFSRPDRQDREPE